MGGCQSEPTVLEATQTISHLVLSSANLNAIPEQIPLTACEINDSLTSSFSSLQSSQMLEVIQFEENEGHNPNIFAVPLLHEQICTYENSNNDELAIEEKTGTLLELYRLSINSQYSLNLLLNKLIIAANFPNDYLEILDFEPKTETLAFQLCEQTVHNLIQEFDGLPKNYCKKLLFQALQHIIALRKLDVNINTLSSQNLVVLSSDVTLLRCAEGASRHYEQLILPYHGVNDEFMLGSLCFECLVRKPIYFWIKSHETLLLCNMYPFSSDYLLEDEFAEFIKACQQGTEIDEISRLSLFENINFDVLDILGGNEQKEYDEDDYKLEFMNSFKAEAEDNTDFGAFELSSEILSDDFFTEKLGCCSCLIDV